MAISSAICNTFKRDLLKGFHDFDSSGGDTFKIALYTSSASLGATTTDYSATNEITNTSGSAYTAGGKALTNNGVTGSSSATTAFVDFADAQFTSASFPVTIKGNCTVNVPFDAVKSPPNANTQTASVVPEPPSVVVL